MNVYKLSKKEWLAQTAMAAVLGDAGCDAQILNAHHERSWQEELKAEIEASMFSERESEPFAALALRERF